MKETLREVAAGAYASRKESQRGSGVEYTVRIEYKDMVCTERHKNIKRVNGTFVIENMVTEKCVATCGRL